MSISAKKHPYFSMTKAAQRTEKDESEALIQMRICKYLKARLPHTRFTSTLNGEHFDNPVQRERAHGLQSHRGISDMLFFERRHGYTGMALELKKAGTVLKDYHGRWKKAKIKVGEIYVDYPHIQEQYEYLKYLEEQGWFASFAIGYKEIEDFVNWYFDLKPL